MCITADFSRRLMTTKTRITLSTTVLAAVALLFASAPLAVTQAHAFWGGCWGWHHPWWHHGWDWDNGGWDDGGWDDGGWGHGGRE